MKTLRFASLIAVIALAGCGGSSGGKTSIVLYNGQHLELTRLLVTAFEKQSGINVRIRTNDSIVLAGQLIQEGSASPADVYISENSPELMTLEEKGLLAKLSADTLGSVPAVDSSPSGVWAGMALRVNSLVYDPAELQADALPASILDLAKPEWKGKVAIAPSDSDFPPIVSAVLALHGEAATSAWLAGLKRNAKIYQDEEAVVSAVNRGNVASGLINSYYWYRLALELGKGAVSSTVHYFPSSDAGSITNISGAAVLEASGNKAAAEQFVAFLLSDAGQKIIAASDDFEYPARPGVAANSALPALSAINHRVLSVSQIGDDKQAPPLLTKAGLL